MFCFAMHFENISSYIISHVSSKDILVQAFLDIVCFEFEACARRLHNTV